MVHFEVIFSLAGLYVLLSILTILFFLNNPFFWRSREYQIPFGGAEHCVKSEVSDPDIRYWKCINSTEDENWVVILHSWGRSSIRMVAQAQVYWDLGYSLIFVDARSHGQSQFTKMSQGFQYAEDVERVLKKENIDTPIVHGLSFGAIAASVFAYRNPVRALILEALIADYEKMVNDTLHLFHLPRLLFGWIPKVLLKMDLPFEEYSPVNTLKTVEAPIFLIHGEDDTWFTVDKHLYSNLESIKSRENIEYWIVDDSDHAHMSEHPDYSRKLTEFILQYVGPAIPIPNEISI